MSLKAIKAALSTMEVMDIQHRDGAHAEEIKAARKELRALEDAARAYVSLASPVTEGNKMEWRRTLERVAREAK